VPSTGIIVGPLKGVGVHKCLFRRLWHGMRPAKERRTEVAPVCNDECELDDMDDDFGLDSPYIDRAEGPSTRRSPIRTRATVDDMDIDMPDQNRRRARASIDAMDVDIDLTIEDADEDADKADVALTIGESPLVASDTLRDAIGSLDRVAIMENQDKAFVEAKTVPTAAILLFDAIRGLITETPIPERASMEVEYVTLTNAHLNHVSKFLVKMYVGDHPLLITYS
jgi:hypothetical protein